MNNLPKVVTELCPETCVHQGEALSLLSILDSNFCTVHDFTTLCVLAVSTILPFLLLLVGCLSLS